MKFNKTLLAVIIASTTSAAYADLNKAIDLVDGLTHKSISFDEGHSEWQNMDSETQREAHQYDHAQGTHFTSDYREGEHTEYARGEATATYHEAAQSDVKPVYSGESHRPAMTTTQDDLASAHIARTVNQHIDYNAQVVAAHDIEAAKVKGKLLTNANIARTADQHTTQSALTHATATATPDIDRTQHLDSNATGQDRQTAKLNAVMEQSQVNADAVKGLQLVQANQQRTASQHVTEEPHNGIDGKTGAQGEKGDAGVTTTITKVQTDTATQTQVAQNQTTLRHVQEEQTAQGEYVQHMNQTVSHTATLAASNSQRLNAVESHQKSLEQQQSNDREEYRAGIAGAVAISGLHYTEMDNSVAIGAGDFKNEQGYALGYRHKFSDNVATTVAASETSNGDAMFSASAAIGW
ncbi:YadA C-terminal domain-containing protein [Enterobacter asburiae]|nr:YadA C-terminal domain-containing protein [Enterobacter asburiae]